MAGWAGQGSLYERFLGTCKQPKWESVCRGERCRSRLLRDRTGCRGTTTGEVVAGERATEV